MIVSYKWLNTYFDRKLPPPNELADILTRGAFEVENVEKRGDDYVLDIDVLPNRAHDSLSHRGVAREIATLLDLRTILQKKETVQTTNSNIVQITNKEESLCHRYIGRKIEGVKVGEAPAWLRARLEAIGQKSINNVIDATNYVMFDIGQPLHMFDADKVEGGIVIRKARGGEKITTLDGKEVELDDSVLIIADEKAPLAIAGIKGGKKAEVDEHTTNIILEAANFAPVNVRKTSRRLNILTDSSKRFENEITPELAKLGMEEVGALIGEIAGGADTKTGEMIDAYPRKANPYNVGIAISEINRLSGADLSKMDIENIFRRLGFPYEEVAPMEKIRRIVEDGIVSGAPYLSGASVTYGAPKAFDCSSLIAWIFKEAGVALPRISVDQFVFTERVSRDDISFGELVFSNTGLVIKTGIYTETVEFLPGTKVEHGVDHVGVYIGEGKVLHASSQTGKVVIEPLDDAKMFENIVGYGRVAGLDEKRFVVTIPDERLDLRIKEDVVEEIVRVYGYNNIDSRELEGRADVPVNKIFYYENKIRNILVRGGFSEVYTYAFADMGEVEIENPASADKAFMRSELLSGVKTALENNMRYAGLLETDKVKMFEIGKVFSREGERLHLCIAVRHTAKKKRESEYIDTANVLGVLSGELDVDVGGDVRESVVEIDLEELVDKLSETESYYDTLETYVGDTMYKAISLYPFVMRDIAVLVPAGTEEDEIREIIIREGGELMVRGPKLFDRFEKEDKKTGKIESVSYAFRMVFQSRERTLTDEEVNAIMERMTAMMNAKEGWRVR